MVNVKTAINLVVGGIIDALEMAVEVLGLSGVGEVVVLVIKLVLLSSLFLLNLDLLQINSLFSKIKRRGKAFFLNSVAEILPFIGGVWPGGIITGWLLSKT